jgi:hypothetical protein
MIANTMEEEMEALRFPIGRWKKPAAMNAQAVAEAIADIAKFPVELGAVLKQMDANMLGRRYRPGGWTGKQVIHHLADSHMNAYIRFKLALTEEQPTIKPYMEDRWAQLPDYEADIELSVQLLKALHAKWAILLRSLSESDWQREYAHPEYGEIYKLWTVLSMYHWHCAHHLGHLKLILADVKG